MPIRLGRMLFQAGLFVGFSGEFASPSLFFFQFSSMRVVVKKTDTLNIGYIFRFG
jgi:hypothetical protein